MSPLKFKFVLWKRYFDTGFGVTSYIKYALALFGIASLDVSTTLIFAAIYFVACFAIGYWWFRYKFAELENEVNNQANLFMHEMREMKNKVDEAFAQK